MAAFVRRSLILACLLLTSPVSAAEPAQEEKLPEPRKAPQVIGPPLPEPMYYRHSQYDIWQLVAPDATGYFRPRVIASPSGYYWAYNGKPYPYAPLFNAYMTPSVAGTPNRAAPAFMPYCDD